MQIAPNNKALGSLQYVDKAKFVATCREALAAHNGHRVRAAQQLQISVRAFYRWIAKYPEIVKGVGVYSETEDERSEREAKRERTVRQNAAREAARKAARKTAKAAKKPKDKAAARP